MLIALLFLGYGLIRVGVGMVLLAQVTGTIDIADLAEVHLEVQTFMAERAGRQLLPLAPQGYFAYILIMGFFLSVGAIGALIRKKWSYTILGLYIVLHAALFVNFLEVNPKLIFIPVQVLLLVALIYWRPLPRTIPSS